MSLLRGLLVCAVVAVVGCGKGGPGASGNEPSLGEVKTGLQRIADGGSPTGTLMVGIEMGVANLKKTDPAKGAALEQDLKELKKLAPKQAAVKAKQMLDKLESPK